MIYVKLTSLEIKRLSNVSNFICLPETFHALIKCMAGIMQVGLRRVMVRGAYKFAATNSALRASLMAQMVENPTAMQETQV